jgi:hypothetical protein
MNVNLTNSISFVCLGGILLYVDRQCSIPVKKKQSEDDKAKNRANTGFAGREMAHQKAGRTP